MFPERFYSLSRYYQKTFGKPVYKAAIRAGFSCPNIDGTISTDGCIFCDNGSGYYTSVGTIAQQLQRETLRIHHSHPNAGIIAYFQANTNTYADVSVLHSYYTEAIAQPNIVGISIATRPDCLPDPVLSLLSSLSQKIPLTVELGLQTIHDKTSCIIHRGYSFSTFLNAFHALRQRNIRICVHLINGLPREHDQDMLETARVIGQLYPDGVKIHLLHVLKNTKLADIWKNDGYTPLQKPEYVQITAAQLALLPESTVIERLTGDGARENLLAPLWSLNKLSVRNAIVQHLKQTNSWQGKQFKPLSL